MSTFPKLHIFLGAGGVGKTTLSASYALALANSGKKVGLLSIDPAKRLQSALGVRLEEGEVCLPISNSQGLLRASMLQLDETLKRWIEQKNIKASLQEKLFANPYYTALSEKLASSADTLAAIRIAEWIEQYPDIEDLIVDTAPGIHAIDFIAKPEKVSLFLDSKLVEWLKIFVGDPEKNKQSFFTRILKSGAKKILDGLALVGGKNFLVNFGEFLILLDDIFLTAMARLKFAKKWIFHPSTNIIIVTSVREDAASIAKEFAQILNTMKLKPSLSIINKAFPKSLFIDAEFQNFLAQPHEKNSSKELFTNYFSSYTNIQKRVRSDLESFSKNVLEIPNSVDLDKNQELRLADLSQIGYEIRNSL